MAIGNRDEDAQAFSIFDWRLQNANGLVVDPTISIRDDALDTGDLVNGGSTVGTISFDVDKPGTYYLIYKPSPFDAARGVWQVNV